MELHGVDEALLVLVGGGVVSLGALTGGDVLDESATVEEEVLVVALVVEVDCVSGVVDEAVSFAGGLSAGGGVELCAGAAACPDPPAGGEGAFWSNCWSWGFVTHTSSRHNCFVVIFSAMISLSVAMPFTMLAPSFLRPLCKAIAN